MSTDLFPTLTDDLAARQIALLRAKHPLARARVLEPADLLSLFDAIRSAVALATDDDVAINGTVHGGFVPSSYRGAAESDTAKVSVRRKKGQTWDKATVTVQVERSYAQTRPRGVGNARIVRLASEGQALGRIV